MAEQNPLVMVVEDEALLLEAITKKLELSNMDVIACESAEQALAQLKTLPKLPDAIWLDYYLKDMNGLTFMAELKKNADWEKLPVIVVSNSASEEKVQSILALGAKQYLLKAEHRLDEIITIVKQFVAENMHQ